MNIDTEILCPNCNSELKLAVEPQDNDVYIWCTNVDCDYELES